MTTTATTVARRVAEARWAIYAALDRAPALPDDVAIGAGRLEQAVALVADVDRDVNAHLDPDEVPPRPWRRSAAGYSTPDDVIAAVERILDRAGGMLVHPTNRQRTASRPLALMLQELGQTVDQHRRFPRAFDVALLVHRVLTVALELELAGAGSASALEEYGVTLEEGPDA